MVSLDQPAEQDMMFPYSIGGLGMNPATAGNDPAFGADFSVQGSSGYDAYGNATGYVTIPAGQTTAYVYVDIYSDRNTNGTLAPRPEGDETLSFTLLDPDEWLDPTSTFSADAMIRDVNVSIAPTYTVNETESGNPVTAQIVVNLSQPTFEQDVSVWFYVSNGGGPNSAATMGKDYTSTTDKQLLVIHPGETTGKIEISILDDNLYEGSEDFSVAIDIVEGGWANLDLENKKSIVTINDNDDEPTVSIDSLVSVDEGKEAQLHIRLSEPSTKAITLDVAISNGSALDGGNFQGKNVQVQFDPGIVDLVFAVTTIDDLLPTESIEFYVGMTNLNNVSAGQTNGVVAIEGNQPPVAVDDSYTTAIDVSVSGNVLSNDTDPENDSLTVAVDQGPANGMLTMNPDGSFNYTPNSGAGGVDTFAYIVSDGHGNTATGTVTITVGTLVDGYWHDEGSWLGGYEHENGYWQNGHFHDNGTWVGGFEHDLGTWVNGFVHDVGYWTPGLLA